MNDTELQKRKSIIEHCLEMNSSGLNQGTSGNISIRHDDGLLITPTSMPYNAMKPEDIVFVDAECQPHGPHKPSSEWQFHKDILDARPEIHSVVHAHPVFCATLAIMGMEIPPVHYIVAIFGGPNVRCAPYAIFGSKELSEHAVTALEGRKACLLDHHGMIAIGTSLTQAMWLAVELETVARQYHGCLQLGEPPLLTNEQIQDVIDKIGGYGHSED